MKNPEDMKEQVIEIKPYEEDVSWAVGLLVDAASCIHLGTYSELLRVNVELDKLIHEDPELPYKRMLLAMLGVVRDEMTWRYYNQAKDGKYLQERGKVKPRAQQSKLKCRACGHTDIREWIVSHANLCMVCYYSRILEIAKQDRAAGLL